MDCRDYKEIISAHVDGALAAEEESEVKAHLDQCPGCRRIFIWETKATSILRRSLSPLAPRHGLKQKLLDQLGQAGDSSQRWLWMPRAWIPALSFLLIIGVTYLLWPSGARHDVFADTATRYEQATQTIEHPSHTDETTPTVRLLDLRPWGYRLLEQRVDQVEGQERRVFVYQGSQKDLLVAQELEGADLPRPRGSTVLRKLGRDFVSVRKGKVHLVAWQDKNMICVLASNLPKDRVIALAEQIAARG